MSQGKSPARPQNEPETKMTESREFRQMLEKRERELFALSDGRIQQLSVQVSFVLIGGVIQHEPLQKQRLGFKGI